VTRFFAETIVALEGAAAGRARTHTYTNEKVTVSSSRWTRSAAQARQAKERDQYRCRVCGECPLDRYGADGEWCLKAHHLEGLARSRKGKTVTVLDSLVTVCANCHRVLTRLDSTRRSFASLRRRFARRTKA
jgi:predicted HNH restriction endonuclease